jgi:hypothetical protein
MSAEKKFITAPVYELVLAGCTLFQAKDTIDKLIQQHGSRATIDWYQHNDEERRVLMVSSNRPETDNELAQRVDAETRWAAYTAGREIAEYERLRAKFGPLP